MIATADMLSRRKASGIMPAIGVGTAFLFGIHCISLSSSGIIPFSWIASVWPGASIIGVLSVAVVFCILHAITYAVIGSLVPREGSDYVFASRTISPVFAFGTNFAFVIASGIVAGGLAAWVPATALPSLLRPMAIIFHDPSYADLADGISSPLGSLIVGTLIIVLSAMTTTKAGGALKLFLASGFVFGLIAWAIILWSLWDTAGPSDFQQAWNTFMGQSSPFGHYADRIPLATQAGMQVSHDRLSMTLAGLIMGFWVFYGYIIPTFFAEEVERPRTSLVIASLSALFVSYAIFAAAALALGRLTTTDWLAAEGYLANNPDAVSQATGGRQIVAMPWVTFYAAILKPVPALIYIVAFSWIFTLINLVQTYLFYVSRFVVSWTQDQVLPRWFLGPSDNPSFHRAVVASSVLALVGLADASFKGPLGTQIAFVFFVVILQTVPVGALTLLPWLRPQVFSRLPDPFRGTVLGVPWISLLGFLTLSYLIWMIIASFVFPGAGVPTPLRSLSILLVLVVGGAVIFFVMSRVRAKEGISIRAIYQSGAFERDAREGPDFD